MWPSEEHCFDLSHEPLYRMRLLRTHFDGQWVLLVTLHHIIADGWSLGVFFKELTEWYRAAVTGRRCRYRRWPSSMRTTPIGSGSCCKGKSYSVSWDIGGRNWRMSPHWSCRRDRPRPALQSHRGDTVAFSLSAKLRDQLQALSGQQRYDIVHDVAVGLQCAVEPPVSRGGHRDRDPGCANRPHPDVEGLIGFFVNMVVLRCDLSGRPSFEEVLARTRETSLQAYAHHDVPFEHLVEVLNPGRSLNRSPLFQVVFAMQNTPWESRRMPAVEMSPLSMEGGEAVAHYDLTLNVREEAAGLFGVMEYCSDLFSRESIENLLSQYTGLLEQIVADTSLPIDEYAVVTPWDQSVYRETWGGVSEGGGVSEDGSIGEGGGVSADGTIGEGSSVSADGTISEGSGVSTQGTVGEPGSRLVTWDEWSPTRIVVADEDGAAFGARSLAGKLTAWHRSCPPQASRRANALASSRAWVGARWWRGWRFSSWVGLRNSCPRVWERSGGDICVSLAGIVRILDSTAAGEAGGDLKVAERWAALGSSEVSQPDLRRPRPGVALRVHVRHASGKLLASQWDEAALLRSLLGECSPELTADPVWKICGLSPRVVSMLAALARAERWRVRSIQRCGS